MFGSWSSSFVKEGKLKTVSRSKFCQTLIGRYCCAFARRMFQAKLVPAPKKSNPVPDFQIHKQHRSCKHVRQRFQYLAATTQHDLAGSGYFLPAFLPAPLASPPPAACAAFLAAFSCSALASRSRRCSGVSPSSRPLATGRRACALCRSRSRWSPRAAPRSGQGQQQHYPKHTPIEKRKDKEKEKDSTKIYCYSKQRTVIVLARMD
jgi:hypothetical protein